jgi:hypothetical protein
MTDQHPITPPPELVEQWEAETAHTTKDETWHVAVQAARWGAAMELEACCEWLLEEGAWPEEVDNLRAARRPTPQTLNSIALQMLSTIERDGHYIPEITDTIRRALEALPE